MKSLCIIIVLDLKLLQQKYQNQNVSFVQCDLASSTEDIMQSFEFIQNLDILIYAAGQSVMACFKIWMML